VIHIATCLSEVAQSGKFGRNSGQSALQISGDFGELGEGGLSKVGIGILAFSTTRPAWLSENCRDDACDCS
jgi:hypothetical protein